jgi:hypothetical protein
MSGEYVAYKGERFDIEWYYSPKGESQPLEYYLALNTDDRVQVLKLFKMMGDIGRISDTSKFRYEGDKIYICFQAAATSIPEFLCGGQKSDCYERVLEEAG